MNVSYKLEFFFLQKLGEQYLIFILFSMACLLSNNGDYYIDFLIQQILYAHTKSSCILIKLSKNEGKTSSILFKHLQSVSRTKYFEIQRLP